MSAGIAKKLSCGAVLVRSAGESFELLLLRAFNNWDFPKGMREGKEQPLDTALREIREETTLEDITFPWGEAWFETGPYSRGKTARYYLALTAGEGVELPVNPELGRPEHVEYRWVTMGEAEKLVTPRVVSVINWARPYLLSGLPA